MYTVKVDPHTHTIFSGHAFSTVRENAIEASERQLTAIGLTDHFGEGFLPAALNGKFMFPAAMNMESLPEIIHGVRVLAGAEIDIVDQEGHLYGWNNVLFGGHLNGITQLEAMLRTREVTIASDHGFIPEGEEISEDEGTKTYVNVLQTPGVHILGHIGRSKVPFHIDTVVKEAKRTGKMIEINNHSFRFGEKTAERCRQIALACAKEGTYIAVSSDAHSAYHVGTFDMAFKMLEEINFPQTLIANESLEKFLNIIKKANQMQGFEKRQKL